MVQLVFDGRTETVPLEELKGLSAGDLLKKVFNDDLEKAISSKLIYDGRILNATTLLGELNDIADTKHFRIVSRQPPKPSVTVTVDQKKLEALQRVVTSIQEHERTQLTMALMDQLSDSRHLHKQTKEWPALLEDPVACQVVNDHFLILALLGEELDAKKREFLNAHPIVIDVLYGMLMKAHNPRRMPPPQQLLPEPVVPVQMITPDMLQRAMQAALGAFQPQRQQIPTASTAAIPQQPTVPPPAERFQAQLAQLIEFGFTNEEQNLEMLLVTDGNVEQALDLLISQREEGNY